MTAEVKNKYSEVVTVIQFKGKACLKGRDFKKKHKGGNMIKTHKGLIIQIVLVS